MINSHQNSYNLSLSLSISISLSLFFFSLSLSLSYSHIHWAYYILDWRRGLQNGEVTSKVGKYTLPFTKGNLMRYECTCISELKRNTGTQNLNTCILNNTSTCTCRIAHTTWFFCLSPTRTSLSLTLRRWTWNYLVSGKPKCISLRRPWMYVLISVYYDM